MNQRWQIDLSVEAQRDFAVILRWTAEHFGRKQARTYEKTLKDALHHLAQGPTAVGCSSRPDFGQSMYRLHVARKGRKGRHFIVFRAVAGKNLVIVLRLLHDSMDLARHLPEENHS